MDTEQEFLHYYLDELTSLRRMGRDFARSYPKVAGRLELADGHSSDPHVERLIESFAFLAARLQRRLDLEFPDISTSLLEVLYPNLVQPVPPLAIARFEPDPEQGKLTTGHIIPRHTRLFAQTRDGLTCRFRTCYPVELWPVEVTGCALIPRTSLSLLDDYPQAAGALRVRLESRGTPLHELPLERLRFFLNGDSSQTSLMYELFADLHGVLLVPEDESKRVLLDAKAVSSVGFAPDEAVIPSPSHGHPAYRLLQEYLQFPTKFHFLDVRQLQRHRAAERLELLFLFRRMPPRRITCDASTLLLGCTPIANLFAKTSEPVRIDQRQTEYRLVADQRREHTTEIHSIASVSASSDPLKPTLPVEPFFSFRHGSESGGDAFWTTRRAPTGRMDMPGRDVWISFLDLAFRPTDPPSQIIYAHTLCTNRQLTNQVAAGSRLQMEEAAPVARIACLTRPTDTLYPPLGGATVWRLVSNLSVNHLSLSGGEESLSALREMLRVYNFSGDPFIERQIQGIHSLTTEAALVQAGNDVWRGFCRGTKIRLTFDETQLVGASTFLFATVLQHFFALYTGVNSFTQVAVNSLQRDAVWKETSPKSGYQQDL